MNHVLRCRCINWSEEHGCCSDRKESSKIPPMPPVKPPREMTLQEEVYKLLEANKMINRENQQLREENEKLKAEYDRLQSDKQAQSIYVNTTFHNTIEEAKKLKEENEQLKKLNDELLGKPVGVTEWEKLVAENDRLKQESVWRIESYNKLLKENESLKIKVSHPVTPSWFVPEKDFNAVKEENDKLKADNEALLDELGSANCIADELQNEADLLLKLELLKAENKQLKAQLQQSENEKTVIGEFVVKISPVIESFKVNLSKE